MTSEPRQVFVWVWLPGEREPVVAGRLDAVGEIVTFTYGRSYLEHEGAIPLYLPELPLRRGAIDPLVGEVAGCIADSAPDSWGRRVILDRRVDGYTLDGALGDTTDLGLLTYLLESGSDRIGALDFQTSASAYVPRVATGATLAELSESARRVEEGIPLSPELDQALLHGSSIGGARPKALLREGAGEGVHGGEARGDGTNSDNTDGDGTDGDGTNSDYTDGDGTDGDDTDGDDTDRDGTDGDDTDGAIAGDGAPGAIAKFSSSTDTYPVVKGEFLAMELARRAGLDVAKVRLTRALGKDVLLIDRFDRPPDGSRRLMISALTILGLDELGARYASYAELAHSIRTRFTDPLFTLHELFARITFNILVSNNDDHARNHAAFWDGRELTLTPAYDICPQPRAGGEAAQIMAIGEDGYRMSQLAGCVARASTYMLSEAQAREIVDRQIETIETEWLGVCDLAELTEVDRARFWRRQFLNPYAFEGY